MSEDPKPFADDEAVSAVVPVTDKNDPPILDVELHRVHDVLPGNPTTMPVDALIDEMLVRLNDHDYLATLMMAESIMAQAPGHGLAAICRKEALTALAPMFQGPLVRRWPEGDPRVATLGDQARELLARAGAAAKVAGLLSKCPDPVVGIGALHELLRVGAVQAARVATVAERSNTMPAPPSVK